MFPMATRDPIPWLGMRFISSFYNPRYLLGKGAPGFPRQRLPRVKPIDVWAKIRAKEADQQLVRLTRMTISQFTSLLEDLMSLEFPHVGVHLSFSNKVLCCFIWLAKYPEYSELAAIFGASVSVIGDILRGFVLRLYLINMRQIFGRVAGILCSVHPKSHHLVKNFLPF